MRLFLETKPKVEAAINGWSFPSSAIFYRAQTATNIVLQLGLPVANVIVDISANIPYTEAELLALRPAAIRVFDQVPIQET